MEEKEFEDDETTSQVSSKESDVVQALIQTTSMPKSMGSTYSNKINGVVKETLSKILLSNITLPDGEVFNELEVIVCSILKRMEKKGTVKDLLTLCQILGDDLNLRGKILDNPQGRPPKEEVLLTGDKTYDDGLDKITLDILTKDVGTNNCEVKGENENHEEK